MVDAFEDGAEVPAGKRPPVRMGGLVSRPGARGVSTCRVGADTSGHRIAEANYLTSVRHTSLRAAWETPLPKRRWGPRRPSEVMGADIDDTPASRHSERVADAGRGARKSSTAGRL